MKTCVDCGASKPLAEFYAHPTNADRHDQKCKGCRKGYSRARHERLRGTPAYEEQRKRERRQWWVKRYGFDPDEYAAKLAAQDGRCAICGTTDPGRRSEFFPIDHDHQTGATRGLLCHDCNLSLAGFGDDPDRLLAAAMYLLAHRDVLAGQVF